MILGILLSIRCIDMYVMFTMAPVLISSIPAFLLLRAVSRLHTVTEKMTREQYDTIASMPAVALWMLAACDTIALISSIVSHISSSIAGSRMFPVLLAVSEVIVIVMLIYRKGLETVKVID